MGIFGRKKKKDIDSMTGEEFEQYCANLLKLNGFKGVVLTQKSKDRGADILAKKHWKKYSFQCKRNASNVGNKAVQEAYAGKTIYGADIAVVITNQHFTKQAVEDAKKLQVQLWDRDTLKNFIKPNMRNPMGIEIYGEYDLLSKFADIHGAVYDLNGVVTNSARQMEILDKEYAQKAKQQMVKTNKSIFYCLKMIQQGSFRQGNYFLIPIEENEKDGIIKRYADRFYIGIVHKPHKS